MSQLAFFGKSDPDFPVGNLSLRDSTVQEEPKTDGRKAKNGERRKGKGKRKEERSITERERDRQRERERETETETERQTDRQTDRQTETDRQTDRETENSNSKILFYKDCSLGSVINL